MDRRGSRARARRENLGGSPLPVEQIPAQSLRTCSWRRLYLATLFDVGVVARFVDRGLNGAHLRWLHEVMVEAGLARAIEVLGLPVARQGDQQRLRQGAICSNAGRQLVAVHARQA